MRSPAIPWLPVLLCVVALLAPAQRAQAQPGGAGAAAPNEAAVRFGSAWRLRGEVTVSSANGAARSLREGDLVYVGERVQTDKTAEVVLKTDDAGIVAVRPGASFAIEKFSAEGRASDNMTLRVFGGAVRMVTGWIGRTNRSQLAILTPSATIGIRGTDHEPYVVTSELAAALGQPEGTYNKVNRGGTTLAAGGRTVDIVPGRVGFVRSTGQQRNRALLTLLLPVLLDKIPEFYVPGAFDAELDALSATADSEALRLLDERSRNQQRPGASSVAPTGVANQAAAAPAPLPGAASGPAAGRESALAISCGAANIARAWLGRFDAAVSRRDAQSILAMFVPEVVITATVLDRDGKSQSVNVARQDFVASATTAMQGLSDFRQRRLSVEADVEAGATCDRVQVKSLVLEQGTQGGKPFRFESVEEYTLERRAGRWQAVKAATTQR